MTVTPITWRIIAPPDARDGDSVHLLRERELSRDDEQILIRRDPKPVLCRLVWLNTPEISGPKADPVRGPQATRDAQYWLDRAWSIGPLVAIQYGFEKYGRPLVDVRLDDSSLSVYMTVVKGWDVYR